MKIDSLCAFIFITYLYPPLCTGTRKQLPLKLMRDKINKMLLEEHSKIRFWKKGGVLHTDTFDQNSFHSTIMKKENSEIAQEI